MLLNTSLNVKDEPIACTPVDALRTMVAASIDTLVIEDFVVDRAQIPERLAALLLEERVHDERAEPRAEVYEAI